MVAGVTDVRSDVSSHCLAIHHDIPHHGLRHLVHMHSVLQLHHRQHVRTRLRVSLELQIGLLATAHDAGALLPFRGAHNALLATFPPLL